MLDAERDGKTEILVGDRKVARPLSPNAAKAVERLFSAESQAEVVRLLTEQCADNLPNSKDQDEYALEDLRFEVLKLSDGDMEKLRAAVRLANEDWRDLSLAAGSVRKYKRELLGRDLEPNPRSDAAWRGQIGSVLVWATTCITFLVLRLLEASGGTFFGAGLLFLAAFAVVLLCLAGDLRKEMKIPILFLGAGTCVGVPAVVGFLTGSLVRLITGVIRSLF